jgi:hypothetical protein
VAVLLARSRCATRGGAADANLAHLAGDERRVRGDTAAGGENALGRDHAAEIFGRGLDADEQHLLALVRGLHGAVGVEVDLAGGGAGARPGDRWR